MTSQTITTAQARAEIIRRAFPKGHPKRAKYPPAHVMQASKSDLQALAGGQAQAKAPAVKAARPKGPGSRGGCPIKRLCADHADTVADKGSDFGAWMGAYKQATAWMRAIDAA